MSHAKTSGTDNPVATEAIAHLPGGEYDPVLAYYRSIPLPVGVTPEEKARLAYAGGNLLFEEVERAYRDGRLEPPRSLGTLGPLPGRSTHGYARGLPNLKPWILPPEDY